MFQKLERCPPLTITVNLGKMGSSEGNSGQKVLCCAVSGLNENKSKIKKQYQNKLN